MSVNHLRLLLVEDSEDDGLLLIQELKRGGFTLDYKRVASLQELQHELEKQTWDIVISDYNLPGFDGLAALATVRDLQLDVPFILMTGTVTEEDAVQAMRAGAQDYIMKGNTTRLIPALSRELQESERRHQVKKTLQEKEEQLRQAQKMEAIGQLAGGLAHDFNNILGVIGLHAEAILGLNPEAKQIESSAKEILTAQQRATSLVRQLLTFSRKQALSPVALNLSTLVERMKKMLQMVLGEQTKLTLTCSPDLPNIQADPVHIEQIVMNLTVNARDAMPDGGSFLIETSYVPSHTKSVEPFVRLTLTDTGCGMDEKTKRRIFEPFFTTKEVGKGTGLGLSTVHGIVKQHRGEMFVESTPGKGTKFLIHFPTTEQNAQNTTEALKESSHSSDGKGTILVVEDDEALRTVICTTLSVKGYTVLEASDGKKALELALQHMKSIDLIITDVIMPHMSGPEFIKNVMKTRPDVRVLFLSGHPGEALSKSGLDLTAIHFIGKPFNGETFMTKIGQILATEA